MIGVMNIVRVASSSNITQSAWVLFKPSLRMVESESVKLRCKTTANCSYTTSSHPAGKLLFRQLFEKESSTYTYLLADVTHPQKPALVCLFFSLIKYIQ